MTASDQDRKEPGTPEPRLTIAPDAPDEMKIANLAELVRAWSAGDGVNDFDRAGVSAQLARECFRHGRQSGFRAALNELREKLANSKTIDTAAAIEDFLDGYGLGLRTEHGRWRR